LTRVWSNPAARQSHKLEISGSNPRPQPFFTNMLTAAEISAGSTRLTANKLKTSDKETLLSVFRLYLKSAAVNFSDISARLDTLTDTADIKTAAKLAAVLTKIEETGFGVSELTGGRSGLKFKEADELSFQIRFALTLLGYDLPESFSGSLESTGGVDFDERYTSSERMDVVW
jgi:hypothetical protein